MRTLRNRRPWAMGMAVIFLLGILLVAVNPAPAAEEVKNKTKADTAGTVAQEAPENPGGLEQGVAGPQGPPINPGAGWYIKIHGKNAGTYKYFPHGHPENQSEWDYYGPNPPPYGS